MKRKDETRPVVTSEERRLIDAIAEGLRPEPMGPARQAAFRRALEARLERRRFASRWIALGAAATAAAAVSALLLLSRAPERPARRAAVPAEEKPLEQNVSMYDALVASGEYGGEGPDPRAYLPDDYLVLATLVGVETDGP